MLTQAPLEGIRKRTYKLTPGTLLYIPRGLIHRTGKCGREPSHHWTFTGGTQHTSVSFLITTLLKRHLTDTRMLAEVSGG